MLNFFRPLLELVFLAIAINMGYPHFQLVWYSWPYVGTGFINEWGKAWPPMLASIIIVVIVIVVEYLFFVADRKERKRNERRWDAICNKMGINPTEYNDDDKTKRGEP